MRAVLVLTAGLSLACSPVYLAHESGASRSPATGQGSERSTPGAVARDTRGSGERPRGAESEDRGPVTDGGDRLAVLDAETRALAEVLGALVWPLALDRATVLSSAYGVRVHPVDGASRFHAGLDLRSRAGTPVYAVADGRVSRSGVAGAYGNLVIVEHGAQLASLYGHNQDNLVREGDVVRRGQVIALVGRTGNATGDHLHFELRWRGGTVDPSIVLPRLGSGVAR